MFCNDKTMRGCLEKKFGFISFVNYIFIYLPMKTMQNKFIIIYFLQNVENVKFLCFLYKFRFANKRNQQIGLLYFMQSVYWKRFLFVYSRRVHKKLAYAVFFHRFVKMLYCFAHFNLL